jgi:choline dehydrogenase-like flavoprotein
MNSSNNARHRDSPEFDAVVVGSGAGGCAAAYSLVRSGLRVALVEKGRELPMDSSTLDIDTVVRDGRFKSHETWLDGSGQRFAPEEYFNVGGKTKWYGAALLRYSTAEFAAETAHQCRGWPIAYDDLAPYYDQATQLLGVRNFDCEPALARIAGRLRVRSPGWRSEPMPLGLSAQILLNPVEASHFDGFASVAGLKADAESSFLNLVRASPNLAIFEGVPVTELLSKPDRVRQIAGVRLADGRELRARSVLLAAGALHSPRLLQHFVEHNGLQGAMPSHGEIGRNLKLHVLTAMVAVSASVKSDLIRKTTLFLNDELPHSSVQPLGFDAELIATLIPRWVPRSVANMVGRRAYGFFLQTEDGSHRDNRVIGAGTAESTDKQYPTMDYDVARLRPALDEHRQLIRRFRAALLGVGLISFSQRIGLAGTAHVSGTLIAGDDPRTSVVDARGKVHGLDSLYVVDASILPRSSRVNPSLTIFAWSLRTAAILAAQLTNRGERASLLQPSA